MCWRSHYGFVRVGSINIWRASRAKWSKFRVLYHNRCVKMLVYATSLYPLIVFYGRLSTQSRIFTIWIRKHSISSKQIPLRKIYFSDYRTLERWQIILTSFNSQCAILFGLAKITLNEICFLWLINSVRPWIWHSPPSRRLSIKLRSYMDVDNPVSSSIPSRTKWKTVAKSVILVLLRRERMATRLASLKPSQINIFSNSVWPQSSSEPKRFTIVEWPLFVLRNRASSIIVILRKVILSNVSVR